MIADPPFDAGATHDTDTSPAVADGLTASEVGIPGAVAGVAEAVPDAEPVPAALVADTRKLYDVPLVRPVTVAEVDVEVPSENVVHEPPLGRYSTT